MDNPRIKIIYNVGEVSTQDEIASPTKDQTQKKEENQTQ